ncbi:uncharacterized protein [Coffea arabica]|uniref:CAP-Gly domain-containing linker protein 1-like n=1 Tax=Coffea arabica TaxID=13443 RepID=A0A6P6WWB5_COFAR|nr:uncharacterized protein LOC113733977 [Coffea arabica]XP_027119718.1 uncharacterized protein LOC113736788 [Coffea arabica]
MATSDSNPSAATAPTPSPAVPLSAKKENVPVTPKLAELNESRQELLNRIQNLKQDLQSWRSKLDTQVKVYRDELLELKKSLNVEVDQLRSEFQGLRTTLRQQQEDVTASLKNLGLQDVPVENKETVAPKIEVKDEKDQDLPKEENKEEVNS